MKAKKPFHLTPLILRELSATETYSSNNQAADLKKRMSKRASDVGCEEGKPENQRTITCKGRGVYKRN